MKQYSKPIFTMWEIFNKIQETKFTSVQYDIRMVIRATKINLYLWW